MNLAPVDVVHFAEALRERFDSRYRRKQNSALMQAAARLMQAFGYVQSGDTFLNRYATTLGRNIYLPWKIGAADVDYWGQMITICHEHEHVAQFRSGQLGLTYLLNSSKRARLETDAYRTQLELEFWRYQRVRLPVDKFLDALRFYKVNRRDLDEAYARITSMIESTNAGVVATKAGQRAIEWLDNRFAVS